MQTGAVAVVVAATALHAFELDRFFVPKEFVLHLTAALAALGARGRRSDGRVSLYLAVFLLLSVVSAIFATNPWLAMRAVAITASSAVLFWSARAVRRGPLVHGLAFAVVLVAITALLQTYGVETLLFSESRAPGGTLGNRNFVAHAGAFGLPLILWSALLARTFRGYVTASLGATLVIATLVLTRSRAAWLAFGAVVFVFFAAMIVSRALRGDGRTWRRFFGVIVFAAGGVAAALLIPNTLNWRSNNPYLETLERVAEYQEGSGRGRLVQYEQSLRMALRHPLFGVGPGNWAVEYPEHAARRDPSLDPNRGGTTYNPWPSSDWVAAISERGPAAAIVFGLVFLTLALRGLRQLFFAITAEEAVTAVALLGTITGAVIAGLFDAVLLLGLPAFLVWSALGALCGDGRPRPSEDDPGTPAGAPPAAPAPAPPAPTLGRSCWPRFWPSAVRFAVDRSFSR
jgi:O-antigen ligase